MAFLFGLELHARRGFYPARTILIEEYFNVIPPDLVIVGFVVLRSDELTRDQFT